MRLELGWGFFASNGHKQRRTVTLLGSFAIVFQALVFAWHHHDLPFSTRRAPVLVVAASGSMTPAAVDRDCAICSAIAHHGAVPVDLFAAARPEGGVLQQVPPAAIGTPAAPYLLFRSRAPPRGCDPLCVNEGSPRPRCGVLEY